MGIVMLRFEQAAYRIFPDALNVAEMGAVASTHRFCVERSCPTMPALTCCKCCGVFHTIADTLNSPLETGEMLRSVSKSIVDNLCVKGCEFFLLSRNQRQLENIAFFDLNEKFAVGGPLDVADMLEDVLRGDTVSVSDCGSDPRVCHLPAYRDEGVKSLLLVPLKTRSQVIGSMHITTAEGRAFSSDELTIIQTIAALCTGVILRSMFQKVLHHVSETAPLQLDIKDVLNQIAKVIAEDLRVKGCVIRLLDPDTGRLELWASYGLSQAYLNKGPVDAGKAKVETVEGRCVALYDATQYLQYPEEARREGIASLLSVPLLVHGRSIGYLRIFTHKPYEFSAEEISLIRMVGEQCALLIHSARLCSFIKERYDTLMVDFHNWFDCFYGWGVMEREKVA
jgi:GAF domain-containing protein